MSDRTEYELRLRPTGGNHNAPTVRRLARILKALLRGYGFKCVSARELPTQPVDKGSK